MARQIGFNRLAWSLQSALAGVFALTLGASSPLIRSWLRRWKRLQPNSGCALPWGLTKLPGRSACASRQSLRSLRFTLFS